MKLNNEVFRLLTKEMNIITALSSATEHIWSIPKACIQERTFLCGSFINKKRLQILRNRSKCPYEWVRSKFVTKTYCCAPNEEPFQQKCKNILNS